MPVEKKHFVFTYMNNGQPEEQFDDVEVRGAIHPCVTCVAQTIIRNSSVRTSRQDPQEIEVQAFEITLQKGQPVRAKHPICVKVMPYQVELDGETYTKELDEELKVLPTEFHQFIKNQVADKPSLEESLQTAKHLIYELKEPILQFAERVKRQLQ